MSQKRKFLIAGCTICAMMAIAGAAACSKKNPETPSNTDVSTGVSATKKDYAYAPDITVDWGEYSAQNVPQAVKGKPYQIFNATAEDLYGENLDVTVKVYLHYLEETKALMTLKNNLVTPVSFGVYTVEYTATDIFGNVGVFTYDFECNDVETLSLSLSVQTTNTLAGLETPIANFTYYNAMGNAKTIVTATHKDGKAVYDLTGKDSFLPMYAGEYTIEYACTDYNVTVKESYKVTVENNPTPVFIGEADIPKYFIVGKEYTLPSIEAYQFDTGNPVPFTPVVSVQHGNGALKQISGYSFTPDREASLKFIYTIACGNQKVTKEYVAQAVNVGEVGTTFDITKYFYSPNAKITAGDECLTVVTAKDGAKLDFINTLTSRRFSLSLATTLETTRFDAVDIYLKDSQDESIQLKITYANPLAKDGYISLNDGEKNDTGLYESAVQKISYDEELNEVSFNGGLALACPEDFEGFPSGKIRCSLQISGVKGESELQIYAINNQTLCYWPGDFFAPEIWFDLPAKGMYALGETVELGAIECADVLDPETTLYISVLSPSGEYVTSTSGVLVKSYVGDVKNCGFITTEYGQYVVTIKITDGCGNSKSYNYVVEVQDLMAPEVVFKSKMPKSVKVGEAFTLSEILVTDDLSAPDKCSVDITLIGGPVGDVKILTAGKTYKFQTKGVYYLYYRVEDEAGNTTTLCHKFIVE